MKDFDYQHWLAAASGRSRRRGEAADLLHEALLDAIRAGRTDFSRDDTRRWFAGVLRNRATMTAQSAVRRRRRESSVIPPEPSERVEPSTTFIRSLPTAARRVATLVVAGMNKTEILAVLGLTDTSFRQRLTTIRRAWQASSGEADRFIRGKSPTLDLGLMRRALLRHVRAFGGIGTHDPDGHLIVLEAPKSTSHPPVSRQRTGNRSKEEPPMTTSTPVKPLRVGAIVFSVKDLNRTEAFYRDTIGLKTTLQQERYDEHHPDESMLFAETANTTLIFFQREEQTGRTPIVVFSLADGGIDDVVERLAQRGTQIVVPVSEAPGGWSANFLDPDGHMLSFYQANKLPKTFR